MILAVYPYGDIIYPPGYIGCYFWDIFAQKEEIGLSINLFNSF